MARKAKPVSIEIVEKDGARIIVREYADGTVTREPVPPKKQTRKPKRPPLRVGRAAKKE